jgi:glutamine cyclotransferase
MMKLKLQYVAGMLAGVMGGGCVTTPTGPPDLPDATLVPGATDCHYVARDDTAVWWTSEYSSDLRKADPHTREIAAGVRIPLGYAVTDLATGFGAVWLASGGSQPTIRKVDARTNRLAGSTRLASFAGSKGRHAYVAVGEGAAWATVNVLDYLFRIDPATGAITAKIPVGPLPLSDKLHRLAAGEGGVWVLHDRTVTRIDPTTQRVVARIKVPGLVLGIGEIAIGGGTVWVATGSTLTRIDPRTNQIVATISTIVNPAVPTNRQIIGHMVVANDTLWALAFQESGSFMNPTAGRYALVEFDTNTNSRRATRPLGSGDASRLFFGPTLAVTDNAIWVAQPTGLYVILLASIR